MIVRDIAIVGSSLAGLALARALGQALPGLDIAVITPDAERAQPMRSDPRAYAIAAASRRLLATIGVWDAIAAEAEPVLGIDITDSDLDAGLRPILLQYDTGLSSGEAAAWIIADTVLRQALEAAARSTGGISWIGEKFVGLEQGRHEATVALEGGAQVRARLVVAADGARSSLREAAGIKSVTWSYAQLGIVTILAHEEPHQGRATQHFLPAGPFALLPMKGSRSCITWTEAKATARGIMAGDNEAFLAEAARRVGHRLGKLSLAGPRASWPLELRLARSLVASRLALIGDAARVVHPLAGQGLNLGLRDVASLAETVADALRVGLDPGDATMLERYQRWRRFDGAQSALAFDALNRLFSREERILRSAREAGLGLLDRLAGLKRTLVAEAAGGTGELPRLLRGSAL